MKTFSIILTLSQHKLQKKRDLTYFREIFFRHFLSKIKNENKSTGYNFASKSSGSKILFFVRHPSDELNFSKQLPYIKPKLIPLY